MEIRPDTPARLRGQRLWTDAQRAEQSRLLRQRQIWAKSTGPKTSNGKSTSSRNSYKHGRFSQEMRALRQYTRMAATRNTKIKAFLKYQDKKRENELREKYGAAPVLRPWVKAFFPYFKISPFEQKEKRIKPQSAFDYFTSLSEK